MALLYKVLRSVLYSSGVAQEYWTITSSTAQILFFRPVPSGLLLLVPSPSVPYVPPVVVPTSVGADVLLAVPGEQLIIIICVLLLLLIIIIPGEHDHGLRGHLLPRWLQGDQLRPPK